MATLLNHTYEGGESLATLGYTNISDLATSNTAGLGGSTWGVRGTGGSSAAYYGEADSPTFSPSGRGFSVSADFDHVDSGDNGFGHYAFHLMNATGGWFLQLYHGLGSGADRSILQINSPGGGPLPPAIGWESDPGLIIPGTTQRLTLCGQQSSALGVEDGTVSLYVDDTLIVTLTDVHIYPSSGSWALVRINPMGRFDNFFVTDEGCETADPLPTDASTPCCADAPNPTGPGNTGPVLGPDPYTPLTEWARQCEGGGTVPQAADQTDSESWVV